VRDGEERVVEGVIEAAGPLVAGADGQPCVYWEHGGGLAGVPTERGGERFWVVDGQQRVLVVTEHLDDVRARTDWQEAVVRVATSEIALVSEELGRIKRVFREGGGDTELRAEQRRLKKVATLLCKLKAHARGNVHGNNGTLASQGAWIEKHQHLATRGHGATTMERAVKRWVLTLQPGDPVRVRGRFVVEPLPPGLDAPGGGYRDRPTCVVVHDATVVGRGEVTEAKSVAPEPLEARSAREAEEFGASVRRTDRLVLGVVSALTTAAAAAWWLLH